jgi:two-component system sensor histidine kinase BaeS
VKYVREHLGWKLFLSYLIIVAVGLVVLDLSAELQVPRALERDSARQLVLKANPDLAKNLEETLQSVINEMLLISTVVAVIAAAAVSVFTARRIITPIQAMMHVSQHIAAGDYAERVPMTSQDEFGALAQSLNQMAETLEHTEQRRNELIGNVAHELRTPLTSIKSTLEGLIDGVLPADPDTLSDLQSEVARLQRLVYDLEELSRVEAGQIALELRPIVLADLIRTAVDRLHSQFEDKGVSLEVAIPSDVTVQADPARVIQVLLNLLGNALQYTPPDGTVSVNAWRVSQEVFVAVQDTGIGIAPEQLPHLFERFYRADKSRARVGGGSGIGLTIAKHLVTAHGGRIWAASPGLGMGSTFTFTLSPC